MDDVDNNKQQTTEPNRDNKQIKLWKLSTIILFCLLIVAVALAVFKYLPKKEITTKQNKSTEAVKTAPENSLSFSNQHLDQPLSKYDYALLASPDVLNEQRDKTWQPMECIYSSEERSWYTIADIKKYISD